MADADRWQPSSTEPTARSGRRRRGPAVRRAQAEIKGRKKAAVLLVALGPDRAAEVFKHLRDDEIETLSLEMAKLQHVDPTTTATVLEELAATVEALRLARAGGVDYAREVLERALGPERALEIIGRLSSVIEKRPFEFLRRTPPEQIVDLPAQRGAADRSRWSSPTCTPRWRRRCWPTCPRASRRRSRSRIARMGETSPDVVKQVESVMRQKLDNVVQQEYSAAGGVKSLAEILNHTDRSTERNVLDSLTETDEELAAEVRRLLFVFEDIVKLDDRSIQLVLREADQKDLALALRGVNDDVKERILSNMSERGATDARRGDGVPAAAAQARRRGGPGPDRGDRAQAGGGRRPRALARRGRRSRLSRRGESTPSASSTPRRPALSNGIADVLSAVRAEAEQIRAQARAAGEAEGRAAGMAAARTEAAPAVAAMTAALEAIEQLKAQMLAELEQDAVEMAMRLAEQILAGAVAVEPERVIDVGRNALRHLSERRRVTLVVNPDDLELVSECVDQLQSELGGIEHLGVQSDRRIGRGGAIARTDSGEIDSGLDAQLSRAREIVAAALARVRASMKTN